VVVHPADVQDYDGIRLVFEAIRGRFSRLRLVWADGMYERMAGWVRAWRPARPIRLEVVKRDGPGWVVLPRRWVVERTFAWIGRNRRMSKDYEFLPTTSETWIYLSMLRLMLKRLAHEQVHPAFHYRQVA
jgi:putative transposase